MKRYSIRWRLPLNYAAIAALATLILGVVLLALLRDYYTRLERDYLQQNAQAVSTIISGVYKTAADEQTLPVALADQLRTFAFVSDTQVRLVGPDGQVVAEAAPTNRAYVALAPINNDTTAITVTGKAAAAGEGDIIMYWSEAPDEKVVVAAASADIQIEPPVPDTFAQNPFQIQTTNAVPATDTTNRVFVPAERTLFGFAISSQPAILMDSTRRSDQAVSVKVYTDNQTFAGTLNISDGPAYGSEILDSVWRGWLLAGSIAIILAATAGWFASHQISAPLLALTVVTERMASGDLTARAQIQRRDEFGLLAASFDDMAARIEDHVLALRRFVADAAHELHTPLTALQTNLELTVEAPDPLTSQRALDQVKRLESLTDNLLNLSRIEANAHSTPAQPVDLTLLVRDVSEVWASRAEQCHQDFMLDVPETALVVSGDGQQLQQMVSNLVDNALKFTPPGGTIQVRLHTTDQQAELEVQDSGLGIPPEDLPYLFERFRRGRNTAAYPGSGLGLAIVHAVIQAHHGSVKIESFPGTTHIRVRLPLSQGKSG
ncbi:MAG TPA: HAMP domain-containing sensor histidine kinase [Phototrophicaceae bacterium]|nr:HAMP domain-containing sensor histidine kinase [Phototrophicaceae bacterium]